MWHHTPMMRMETLSAQTHGKRITTHVYWDHLRDVLFARAQASHLGEAVGVSDSTAAAAGWRASGDVH
jgi:hypothetical protein